MTNLYLELANLLEKESKSEKEFKRIEEIRSELGIVVKEGDKKEEMRVKMEKYKRMKIKNPGIKDADLAKECGISYYALCKEKKKRGLKGDLRGDFRTKRYKEFLKMKEKYPMYKDAKICRMMGVSQSTICQDRDHYDKNA